MSIVPEQPLIHIENPHPTKGTLGSAYNLPAMIYGTLTMCVPNISILTVSTTNYQSTVKFLQYTKLFFYTFYK